jgi:alpha-L-rhamnosidase
MAVIIRGREDFTLNNQSSATASASNSTAPAAPRNLRCEYFTNPLCIDVAHPRLSWEISDDRRGAKQSAYQLVVIRGGETRWDSGKIPSDQSIQIAYAGAALKSRTRCDWTVRTWDAHDVASPWSDVAHFEVAFLKREDWKAQWIGSPIVGGPYTIPPAPHLRKEFDLDKPVASARLYVTALGLQGMEINGQRVSDDVFVPGRTEYTRRVPYHVYDVTRLLKSGPNACGAILGDGWYCGHLHSDPRQTYGDRPRLLAQLEIVVADGSSQTIVTDQTWKTAEGPIRSSDMLMGEDYDARLEIPGWSSANFDASKWDDALVFPDPRIEIVAHHSPAPRRLQTLKPIAPPAISANKRRHIFDMGQNMVGWVRLRIKDAPPGKTIDIRYTEMLDKDGKPYTTALRTARATDHYTTRGGSDGSAEEFFEPHFTFHGFRYVEVRDYPGRNPTVDDLTGIVVYSDLPTTGEFECSDPMINQLQSNIVWSQKGNFLDIPTDCPQRDERLGWTGDAQVFIKTAAFNMDVAGFFTKWIQDVADAQYPDGHIPSVVPHVSTIHHEGGPAWADAAVICPWTVYQCYGDKTILENHWPMMTRFMNWLEQTSPGHIRPADDAKWKGYGDWLSVNANTPPDFIGTAFYAHCANLMSKIARILGKSEEADAYFNLFEDVRAAWHNRFVTPPSIANCKSQIANPLRVQTQTAYVLALHFDLLDEPQRPAAVDALVHDINQRGQHLSTGFVGTPYLNHVLTRFGHPDLAYALLTQTTFPSWLYPITQGATTMWERWDAWTHDKGFGDAGMNSYNHYAYGAVGDWIYATVAGIDVDPNNPGYKHIRIRPIPGGGITWARAKFHSMHGPIRSSWRIEGKHFKLDVTIPPNTTATLRLPATDAATVTEGGQPLQVANGVGAIAHQGRIATIELGAGRYDFESILAE